MSPRPRLTGTARPDSSASRLLAGPERPPTIPWPRTAYYLAPKKTVSRRPALASAARRLRASAGSCQLPDTEGKQVEKCSCPGASQGVEGGVRGGVAARVVLVVHTTPPAHSMGCPFEIRLLRSNRTNFADSTSVIYPQYVQLQIYQKEGFKCVCIS